MAKKYQKTTNPLTGASTSNGAAKSSDQPNPRPAMRIEETMHFSAGEDSEAAMSREQKQELDLAFAAALLTSGRVNERQLTRVLRTWTIYGSMPLADRLVADSVISSTEREQLLKDAQHRLINLTHTINHDGMTRAQAFHARASQLDNSGRLAKLMGLNNPTNEILDEFRQLNCRFSLIRKLGEGGLGTVWLARDENLRRYVAIKEIRSRGTAEAEAAIARFQREAELTGRLEHPGIVPIYQFGTDSHSGRFFYVMRFLGKHTMQDAIHEYHERREAGNNEPLLLHRLLTAFVSLCHSVAHAHSRKVIHRDLKPENVALDGFGQVILLDWGLAKVNDETGVSDIGLENAAELSDENNLTVVSQVLGSPMYMAPEQASGRLEEIDERTDVYGLGGILFAILTGHAPHEVSYGDSNSRTSLTDLLSAIVSQPVVRPSTLVSDISPALEAICEKATQKKRYLRYQTASAVAEEVERYLAGGDVLAYEEPPSMRFKRWIAAHPRMSQAIAAAIVFFLTTLAVVGYSMRQSSVAAAKLRFYRAADVAKELSFVLEAEAQSVARDLRFISELPPIQGVVQTRRYGSANVVSTPVDSINREDDEATWVGRLNDILDGLMRTNESYMNLTFLEFGEEIQPLCKIERHSQTGTIRRASIGSLPKLPRQLSEPDFEEMRPGDVVMRTSDRITEDAPTSFRSPLSIAAVTVTFDEETGQLFGFLAVQSDLRKLIERSMVAIGADDVEVYLTDHDGIIQAFYRGGDRDDSSRGQAIETWVPSLEGFFREKKERLLTDGNTYYATRFVLGEALANSTAEIGIVVHIMD